MTDKLPPQNIEAEEEILGGILFDSNAIARVASLLIPDAFYVRAHQQIYKAALELYAQQKPTDLMTLTTWLSDHKLLRKVGGKNKLAQLANCTVSAINIERYAELVLEKYHRRQLITAANEISELGYDTTTEIESVFEQSEEKLVFRILRECVLYCVK